MYAQSPFYSSGHSGIAYRRLSFSILQCHIAYSAQHNTTRPRTTQLIMTEAAPLRLLPASRCGYHNGVCGHALFRRLVVNRERRGTPYYLGYCIMSSHDVLRRPNCLVIYLTPPAPPHPYGIARGGGVVGQGVQACATAYIRPPRNRTPRGLSQRVVRHLTASAMIVP